jgi:phage tail-like protein
VINRPDYLYKLLPAIYREKDIGLGYPLRALFSVLQDQHDLLESDIAAMYDNWFVETCETWILPYIGQLVAAGRLGRRLHRAIDTRALVANTLAYRRRKGTAAVLEEAVAQASGRPTKIVEPRATIAMTRVFDRSDETRRINLDLRAARSLAHLGGAFDDIPRLAVIRDDGLHGLGRVELWQWLKQSYPLRGVDAGAVEGDPARRTFHPLGLDTPLFNLPQTRANGLAAVGERNVPGPLRRNLVALDLAEAQSGDPSPDNVFAGDPAFSIYLDGQGAPGDSASLSPAEMVVADLSDWQAPLATGRAKVAVDPERGRLLLLGDAPGDVSVTTDHCFGFPDDLGGGPYARPASPTREDMLHRRAWLGEAEIWRNDPAAAPPFDLAEALQDWRDAQDNRAKQNREADQAKTARPFDTVEIDGVIEIPDSHTCRAPVSGTRRRPAAEWAIDLTGAGGKSRNLAITARRGERPCLIGGLHVTTDATGGALVLDGLMIEGALHLSGNLALIVRNCTIAGVIMEASQQAGAGKSTSDGPSDLYVRLETSLVGPVRLPAEGARLEAIRSIIDGGDDAAIRGHTGRGPPTTTHAATIHGAAEVRRLHASDTLFSGPLNVSETRKGYVRYCYLPPGSRTPPRYACQPPAVPGPGPAPPSPRFESRQLGQPGYFHLLPGAPAEWLRGASDGQAFGAFHDLGEAVRDDNLADALTEYMPFGLRVVRRHGS